MLEVTLVRPGKNGAYIVVVQARMTRRLPHECTSELRNRIGAKVVGVSVCVRIAPYRIAMMLDQTPIELLFRLRRGELNFSDTYGTAFRQEAAKLWRNQRGQRELFSQIDDAGMTRSLNN